MKLLVHSKYDMEWIEQMDLGQVLINWSFYHW